MPRISTWIAGFCGFAALAAVTATGSGCSGKFAGPPGGSSVSGNGTEPLYGATQFTFYIEDPTITGFYTDAWYIDPGRDSDDAASGNTEWISDALETLNIANFDGWLSGAADPTEIEINNQWPLLISFIAQWYRRNPDGTRIRELDQFGNQVWSTMSLDISFCGAPVEEYWTSGPIHHFEVFRQVYPSSVNTYNIFGWDSPEANDPGAFPPPQKRFLSNQYSEVGVVQLTALLPAGSPQLTQALGVPITDDTQNPNVENMGAIPQDQGGGWTSVATPTGAFGDMFALEYKSAPVIQPTTPGHTVLEAEVEYSRHFGALHANLIAQAIGLSSVEADSIMDPAQVIWQNGYAYSFVQNDLDALDTTHLPGLDRDPTNPKYQSTP